MSWIADFFVAGSFILGSSGLLPGCEPLSEARRLRELESENAKLKPLLADAMLDQAALRDLLAKKF